MYSLLVGGSARSSKPCGSPKSPLRTDEQGGGSRANSLQALASSVSSGASRVRSLHIGRPSRAAERPCGCLAIPMPCSRIRASAKKREIGHAPTLMYAPTHASCTTLRSPAHSKAALAGPGTNAACELLARVYEWFTEDFDALNLKEATEREGRQRSEPKFNGDIRLDDV